MNEPGIRLRPVLLNIRQHAPFAVPAIGTILTVALILANAGRAQIMLNQIDTFESGIANWQNLAGLASVQTGGPGGVSQSLRRYGVILTAMLRRGN